MAAFAPITVADGATTPLNHVYSPQRLEGELASYANRAESFAAGQETLKLRVKETATLRSVVVTCQVPRVITESINGVNVDRVADYMQIKVELRVPRTWNSSDAGDYRVLGSNLLLDSVVASAVDNGEFVW